MWAAATNRREVRPTFDLTVGVLCTAGRSDRRLTCCVLHQLVCALQALALRCMSFQPEARRSIDQVQHALKVLQGVADPGSPAAWNAEPQWSALSTCQPCLSCCSNSGKGQGGGGGGFPDSLGLVPYVMLYPSNCRARSCGLLHRQGTRRQQPFCALSLRCSRARRTGSRLRPWQLWRSPLGAHWKQVGSAATVIECSGTLKLPP